MIKHQYRMSDLHTIKDLTQEPHMKKEIATAFEKTSLILRCEQVRKPS